MYHQKAEQRRSPVSCTALQEKIEVLQWAQNAMKVVPNLPKGKLRDILEMDLISIANGSETYERSSYLKLGDIRTLLDNIDSQVGNILTSKHPNPSQVTDLRTLLYEVRGLATTAFNELDAYFKELNT